MLKESEACLEKPEVCVCLSPTHSMGGQFISSEKAPKQVAGVQFRSVLAFQMDKLFAKLKFFVQDTFAQLFEDLVTTRRKDQDARSKCEV